MRQNHDNPTAYSLVSISLMFIKHLAGCTLVGDEATKVISVRYMRTESDVGEMLELLAYMLEKLENGYTIQRENK